MATPRDPAAPASPIETADEIAQPEAGTSATESQPAANSIHMSQGDSNAAGNRAEEEEPRTDDASSATRGPVSQTSAATNEEASGATVAEGEHENIQRNEQTTERDEPNTNRPAREEQDTGTRDSADAVNTTLPIRTSSVQVQATPAQAAGSPSTARRESSSHTQFIGPDGQVVDLATIMYPHRSSSIVDGSPRHSPARRSSLRQQFNPHRERPHRPRRETPEFVLPRWQPDAEVTLCPICNTQFSIWVRKHHCRCVTTRQNT